MAKSNWSRWPAPNLIESNFFRSSLDQLDFFSIKTIGQGCPGTSPDDLLDQKQLVKAALEPFQTTSLSKKSNWSRLPLAALTKSSNWPRLPLATLTSKFQFHEQHLGLRPRLSFLNNQRWDWVPPAVGIAPTPSNPIPIPIPNFRFRISDSYSRALPLNPKP